MIKLSDSVTIDCCSSKQINCLYVITYYFTYRYTNFKGFEASETEKVQITTNNAGLHLELSGTDKLLSQKAAIEFFQFHAEVMNKKIQKIINTIGDGSF